MATEINRIARTESLFRDVNERIAETSERFGAKDAEFGCSERLYAQLDDYEQVRADGVHFLVAPGHEEPQYEQVLQMNNEYQVIAKTKDRLLARKARALDPRADDSPPENQANEI